jgi:16S rRNA (cytosine967-C5)-methyltransferase
LQQLFGGRSLSLLLDSASGEVAPADAALIQELCFGVARWWPQLDALTQLLLQRPLKSKDGDIRALIALGLYQLEHMRVAPHAALAETVEAARVLGKPWARGLVNALLRRYQRERETLLQKVCAKQAARYCMPEWLLEQLQRAWPEAWEPMVLALQERPPMTLRVNRQRLARDAYRSRLQAQEAETVSGVDSALVLRQPVAVTALPGFAQGEVSVQDAGAQLAATLLQPQAGERILDACAAPGGKSCHLLELAPEARLTAIDIDTQRLRRVRDNLARLSLQAEVCQGDAAAPAGAWAERKYQRILLDVPCSATGVIRRHPDIKLLRKASDIAPLVDTQQKILHAIWPLLAPGGLLLYATCSLLPEENQLQMQRFLEAQPEARERVIQEDWGRACAVGRQTLPGEDTMDGFYYACLEKRCL